MKRIFATHINKIAEDVLEITLLHLDTDNQQKVCLTVSNPEVMERVMDIQHFPCEEMNYGVHGKTFTEAQLLEMLECVIASAASQVSGTPEYESLQQMGREAKAEERAQRKKDKKSK